MNSARIAVFFQRFHSFRSMFLILRYEDYFGGVVLEDMCCDAEPDARGSAGYYVDLVV